MSNSTLTQEKAKIQDIINSYNEQRTSVKNEIEAIDEKYKKMAEAEKSALNATIAFYESAIDALTNLIGFEAASEALAKKEVTLPNENEQVVDSLFPENNNSDEPESLAKEDKELEFDGAGFTEEDNVPPVEEEKELDLGNMNQDDIVLDFEKEDVLEETEEETNDEEDDDEEEDFKDMSVDW